MLGPGLLRLRGFPHRGGWRRLGFFSLFMLRAPGALITFLQVTRPGISGMFRRRAGAYFRRLLRRVLQFRAFIRLVSVVLQGCSLLCGPKPARWGRCVAFFFCLRR